MLHPITTTRFDKDVELSRKRGKKLKTLRDVMAQLVAEKPLAAKHRDHSLKGNYINRRECHLDPDWLLIYKTGDGLIIFERTGTHSDLFKK